MHPALRRRPIPGSGPRRHDTRHHLIASRACRETSLPASQHYCPGASQGACDALDHAKIAPSTADAATNFLPRSPIRHRLPRPAQPLRKTPPCQIPIVGRPPTRPPRVPSWGAFERRPQHRADRSRPAVGRHPKPCTDPAVRIGCPGHRVCARFRPFGCLRVKDSSRPLGAIPAHRQRMVRSAERRRSHQPRTQPAHRSCDTAEPPPNMPAEPLIWLLGWECG